MDDNLVIPLKSQGTKLVFESRVPTRHELNTCQHIDMCNKTPWDPRSVVMQSIVQEVPEMVKMDDDSYAYVDSNDEKSILHSMSNLSVELKEKLVSKIKVNINSIGYNSNGGDDRADRNTLISDERHTRISEDSLANKFGCSGKTARETLRVTHQHGTRSALLPLS